MIDEEKVIKEMCEKRDKNNLKENIEILKRICNLQERVQKIQEIEER